MHREVKTHDIGDLVRVAVEFQDEISGALVDPGTVKLSYRKPDGSIATLIFGASAIINSAVGVYEYDLSVDQSGKWFYRWWSIGDGQAAEEFYFIVRPAENVIELQPAPGLIRRISDRADGTHVAPIPFRFPPGALGDIIIGVDISPVYGAIGIKTVGTPTVSGGSVDPTTAWPLGTIAAVMLSGEVTANEDTKLTIPVITHTNESFNVVATIKGMAA